MTAMAEATVQVGERVSESDETETEIPIIEFVAPMPGFPGHRAFVLVRMDEHALLFALTSLHDPELRFLVVPPRPFYPEYAPEIPDDALDLLGITAPDQALLLLVVTPGEGSGEATANQMAPIVIHEPSRRAAQVVLNGSGLPIQAELMAAAS
jgi:flagellar assembly factor FliW